MLFVNEIRLLGYLGDKPDIRTFPSGDRIANLKLCTTDKWRDRETQELREHHEWHRVVVREKWSVDYLEQYADKGNAVYVEGATRTRKVTSQAADVPDRYFTEVHASRVNVFPKTGEVRTHDSGSAMPAASASDQQRRPPPPRQDTAGARGPRQMNRPPSNTQGHSHGYPESQFDNDEALNGPPIMF